MSEPEDLLASNRAWAASMTARDPAFFSSLVHAQTPQFLWIGCSDSRVPANQIVGLLPGELFVHRNVGNLVVDNDMNCLAVIQFAVEVLKVEHIIVCGHYRCSAVVAAWGGARLGLIDHWLGAVNDVRRRYKAELRRLDDEATQIDRLCELNVIEQVARVARSMVVLDAWARGQALSLHGWIYRLEDGILNDLGMNVRDTHERRERHTAAVARALRPLEAQTSFP
ncbi:MAG: carbonic anhydrase [Acidobacteria bacterium]|jgi:carbonic anhydrase|nr:carbonic anhydrase [Acidobacteriota bacterium]